MPSIFSALPQRRESPWHKVYYKKGPRENPENLTQNVKQFKLNDYWLNQPSPSHKNRSDTPSKKKMKWSG
jgi:hypothetical protein